MPTTEEMEAARKWGAALRRRQEIIERFGRPIIPPKGYFDVPGPPKEVIESAKRGEEGFTAREGYYIPVKKTEPTPTPKAKKHFLES